MWTLQIIRHVHYEYNYERRIGETPNPGLRIQVNITKKLRIGRVKNMGYRPRTTKNRKNWILKQSSRGMTKARKRNPNSKPIA
jgi:hypothetical protein